MIRKVCDSGLTPIKSSPVALIEEVHLSLQEAGKAAAAAAQAIDWLINKQNK
jgi:hypothetical protein